MCITKAAKILSVKDGGARARFLDSGALRDIDVSLVDAKKGSYVEVFADHAISPLSREEAERKAELLVQVLRKIRG
jgi:hydrogenase maturation factor